MSAKRRLLFWLIAFAVAIPGPLFGKPRESGEIVDYIVKRGDTFDSISARYLARGHGFDDLMHFNKVTDPHRLWTGQVIAIPASWLRRQGLFAELASTRGAVRATQANRQAPALAGMHLAPGARIETGAQSFATMVFPDGTQVMVLPQTAVRIGPLYRVVLTGSVVRTLAVEGGRIETSVVPFGTRRDSFRVETPLAVVSVRGTRFRVRYDGTSNASTFEVIHGKVEVGNGAVVPVAAGEGLAVDRAGSGTPVRPPGAVVLAHPGRIQDGEAMAFTLQRMTTPRWHAILASDAGFLEPLLEAFSDSPDLTLPALDNGTYYLRVTGISPDGFEGEPIDYVVVRERYAFGTRLDRSSQAGHTRYVFRWRRQGKDAETFRFVLRADGPLAPPLVDETGLRTDRLELLDLPPGTYRWTVGRSNSSDPAYFKWDEDHVLVVSADR